MAVRPLKDNHVITTTSEYSLQVKSFVTRYFKQKKSLKIYKYKNFLLNLKKYFQFKHSIYTAVFVKKYELSLEEAFLIFSKSVPPLQLNSNNLKLF
jgi:hypothetical protein